MVEFEFFPPEEKDFLGLKALLVPYLNSQEYDSSSLINAIIEAVRRLLTLLAVAGTQGTGVHPLDWLPPSTSWIMPTNFRALSTTP